MTNNLLSYKGYFGSVEASLEDQVLHGKLECINDLVTYEAKSIPELKVAFEEAVDDYLETCKELGKEAEKVMSGTFNVRIGPSLHKLAYLAAKSQKISLNDYIKKAVENSLSDKKEFHIHIDRVHEIRDLTFGTSRRKHSEQTKWTGIFETRTQH